MNIRTEYMGSDWIKPRLVTWFNSQSSTDRTIPVGQLYLIKVTILLTADGTPVFVVGTDPTLSDTSRQYVGDATYLWVGATGSAAIATTDSFFEVSKTVESTIRVVPYTLTIREGTA